MPVVPGTILPARMQETSNPLERAVPSKFQCTRPVAWLAVLCPDNSFFLPIHFVFQSDLYNLLYHLL